MGVILRIMMCFEISVIGGTLLNFSCFSPLSIFNTNCAGHLRKKKEISNLFETWCATCSNSKLTANINFELKLTAFGNFPLALSE